MKTALLTWCLSLCLSVVAALPVQRDTIGASQLLLPSPDGVTLWWALSSCRKIQPDQAPPGHTTSTVSLACSRNEREAVQLVVRPSKPLEDFQISIGPVEGPSGAVIPPQGIELLQVMYSDVKQPSDRMSLKGLCPDPLLPLRGPVNLKPNFNQAFWIRVYVPSNAPAGNYRGTVLLRASGVEARVAMELRVYDFAMPERMTCTTAFGFSPGNVFRYHRLTTDSDKRTVLQKYWANLAAHHVSPYDPAPLDPIRVKWPDIHPPRSQWDNWTGLRIVTNEVHSGQGSLLIYDDKTNENVTVSYEPLIKIPAAGLRLKFWYRTAVPSHRFIVTLNHYDTAREWMSGRNNDIALQGSGVWQSFDRLLTNFPAGAQYVRFQARATLWTDGGEGIGLTWLDDLSLTDLQTGQELLPGGDFERKPRKQTVVPPEQLKAQFDFAAWDMAMQEAIDRNHFNSFRVDIPGIGGGTFHAITQPELLGFAEDTPEYPVLFDSYCRQLEDHLKAKGWLDEAYIYWFDEPSPEQYPFVMNGFAKLKRSCPGIARMLTEQVEPALLGGPTIWCSISDSYDHGRAEPRRSFGEKFWWYVCTGPKAPYAGLFLDHPAPEMRIWLWQTFQRNIEGILVWETTYWTSSAAYPNDNQPQNPYTDPMSWTSGYSTPAGDRRAWGNGDGRFIYPPLQSVQAQAAEPILDGPVDSIRWEQLRDGIEDYEYLCILKQRLAARKSTLSPEAYDKYSGLLVVPESITRSLTEFAQDGAPIEAQRRLIAGAIEALR